ncbi:MAG: hypothetical protein GIX03_15930 [Candidatus Eremiobacteraeota bacterium]|nr:hypothetical protein [Candidatus Eremiobacteraeota bacterium]MBC5804452.1 hypothetical protein [Candidatus Eremiobacteraeota bacterium]MBC5821209.1 hypothetical protein [Candidatus Eremiobacteraeota bacterium]
MNLRKTTTAVIAGFAIGTAGIGSAMAQLERNQGASDASLHSVRMRIEMEITNLERDRRDYGGHRVNAIKALNTAHRELLAGEEYARAHRY